MRLTALHGVGLLVLGAAIPGVAAGPAAGVSVQPAAKVAMAPVRALSVSDRRFLLMGAAGIGAGQVTAEHGADLYKIKCSMCHGPERAGMVPVFPSLVGVTDRLKDADIASQIKNGKGKMPPVPDMSDDDIASVILFLKTPVKPAQ